MRSIKLTNANSVAVLSTLAEQTVKGFTTGPYMINEAWVDEMTALLAELKRARSVGDLDELFELTADVESLISELVEVPSED